MRLTPKTLTRWMIVMIVAVNVYRAATLSITADEAFTFNRSVVTPVPKLWESYDANDHVLHTMLCKVTVGLFGVSEFALRLPALAGGVLLLVMYRRLSRLFFGDGWRMAVCFLLLALNPFLLDYGSIARGYGMATALLLVALELGARLLREPLKTWRLSALGVTLALAVAANLTVAIPGLVLVLVVALLYVRNQWRWGMFLDQCVVPGVVGTAALLLLPLMHARAEHFYVGSKSVVDAALSLAYACFWRPQNWLEHTALHPFVEAVAKGIGHGGWVAIPVLGLMSLWWNRGRERVLWVAVTLGSMAALGVLHATVGLAYPERRTGLYFVPLLTVMAVMGVERLGRWALAAGVPLLVLLGLQWTPRFYDEWIFDAGSKPLMKYLRDRRPADGRKLTIGATFPLDHAVQFYRHKYKLDWLVTPGMHKGADGAFDVYMVTLGDLRLMEKYKLQQRMEHPVSHVILAVPPSSPLRP